MGAIDVCTKSGFWRSNHQYNSYYSENEFVKNKYTQFYKRWIRSVKRQNWDAPQTPSENQYQQLNDQEYLSRSLALRTQKSPTSPWQCIGAWDFDKEAASRSYAPGAAHIYTIKELPLIQPFFMQKQQLQVCGKKLMPVKIGI
ncbi:MAG: hypothetical protein JKY42_04490 [Flavobacteriales bacterium]|nr:hypothetical protein [Flavobacteriales bacterium]